MKSIMRRYWASCLAVFSAMIPGCGQTVQMANTTEAAALDPLSQSAKRINGTMEKLAGYRGQVVLVVNTASRCGFTSQYEALEAMYRMRKDRGFVILGCPSNDFLGQEPGTNEEIVKFCSMKFDVSFPMFEKMVVKGIDAHPLFKMLASAAGEPAWNFNKYLIDRQGRVVARYASGVRPEDPELRDRVDALLDSGDG